MCDVIIMAYKETTEKYKGATKTYWITYEVPRKGAEEPMDRAKRFYVPGELQKTEGPGTFENKRGHEKFGIKITYEKPREGYATERGATEYDVGETETKVTKIVELPEDAINVNITDKEPKSAMSVE
ncbi:MAG: hypothetical protein ACXVH4_03110 [Halobacteriota archaeon]